MSAILAIVSKTGQELAPHHFQGALAALRWRGRHHQVEELPAGWIGVVHPLACSDGLCGTDLHRDDHGNIAACHGHLYDLPDLYRSMEIPLPEDIALHPARAILDACLKWGRQAPDHWSGEASFVFWNATERKLMAGRDHLGTRPLFYYDHGGMIAFCTDSKALLTLGGRIPEPDPVSMHRFLCLDSWQDERSFFLRIKRVLPGRMKILVGEKLQSFRYWQPGFTGNPLLRGQEDFHEEFKSKISQAIQRRVAGTGSFTLDPRRDEFHYLLGALLGETELSLSSDGIDRGGGDRPRGILAAPVPMAELTGDELLDEMDRMNIFHDEPVASLAVICSWMLRNEGSQTGAGVQLNQIGARELLGQEELSLSYLLRSGRINSLAHRIGTAGLTNQGLRRGFWAVMQHVLGPLLPPLLLDTRRSFRHKDRFPWLNSTLTRLPLERSTRLEGEYPSEVHHRLALAITHGVLPLKLHYEDRHAGILGLETRYPFLDLEVVRYCMSLHPDNLYGPDSLGTLVRQAAPQVIGADGKRPVGLVMREVLEKHWEDRRFQERVVDTLSRSQLVSDGWLRADKLAQLQNRVLRGNRDFRPHLWRVLTLEGWYRQRWSAQAKAVRPPALRIAPRSTQQSG